jgi:hypothetical protein
LRAQSTAMDAALLPPVLLAGCVPLLVEDEPLVLPLLEVLSEELLSPDELPLLEELSEVLLSLDELPLLEELSEELLCWLRNVLT